MMLNFDCKNDKIDQNCVALLRVQLVDDVVFDNEFGP